MPIERTAGQVAAKVQTELQRPGEETPDVKPRYRKTG
jgi:hypothetical protein